jgi:hypothetical protein
MKTPRACHRIVGHLVIEVVDDGRQHRGGVLFPLLPQASSADALAVHFDGALLASRPALLAAACAEP